MHVEHVALVRLRTNQSAASVALLLRYILEPYGAEVEMVSMAEKASEFGGVPGMIAPEPHKLLGHEEAGLMRRIDSMDGTTSVEDQRIAEARREKRSGIANPDGFTGE